MTYLGQSTKDLSSQEREDRRLEEHDGQTQRGFKPRGGRGIGMMRR